MKSAYSHSIGDWFGSVDCQIDHLELLPQRHLEAELQQYIEREPQRAGEFRAYFEKEREQGRVGDFVAATDAFDVPTADAVLAEMGRLGVPTVAFATLKNALGALEELRERYGKHEYAGLAFAQFVEAISGHCARAREALHAAEKSYGAWANLAPEDAVEIGTTMGGKTYLSMADIAFLTRSSTDAARKLVREKNLPVHRFGRPKYVLLEDWLRATREEPSAPAS